MCTWRIYTRLVYARTRNLGRLRQTNENLRVRCRPRGIWRIREIYIYSLDKYKCVRWLGVRYETKLLTFAVLLNTNLQTVPHRGELDGVVTHLSQLRHRIRLVRYNEVPLQDLSRL